MKMFALWVDQSPLSRAFAQWCRREIDAVAGQVRTPNLGIVLYLSYRMEHGIPHVATLSAPHESPA